MLNRLRPHDCAERGAAVDLARSERGCARQAIEELLARGSSDDTAVLG